MSDQEPKPADPDLERIVALVERSLGLLDTQADSLRALIDRVFELTEHATRQAEDIAMIRAWINALPDRPESG